MQPRIHYDGPMPTPSAAPDDRSRPAPAPLDDALARVGDRWTLLIVDALMGGARRFSDLAEHIPGIAPNVLSQRLRALEKEGVVLARPYSTRPPRSNYVLSAAGRELAGALRLLAHWGARTSDEAEPFRHDACGTPLEPRWFCPTCARVVDDRQDAEMRYL